MEMQDNLQELNKAIREGYIIPERTGEYWSPEDCEELRIRYGRGEGISEIALHLQRSEMAVIQRLMLTKLLTSPGTARSRKPKQPRCHCGNCPFNPNRCEKVCYCVMEEPNA